MQETVFEEVYSMCIQATNAIREILKTYIDEEDIYTDCKVKKEWVKNFEELTNDDFPLKSTDIIKKKDFLNKSIKKFLEQKNPTLDGKSLMEVMPDSSILLKDKLTFKKGN